MMKLLVANRGEIALRVVRTAAEMGHATVAVFSDADRNAPYVAQADEAYHLPGSTAAETYLNQDLLLEIMERSGANAVHPGYGFLSENSEFAARVQQAGHIWVGPDPQVLDGLGDKITACQTARNAGVPPVPGISEPVSELEPLLEFAHTHQYPVMMKRSDGGGGRGITLIHSDEELRDFYAAHNSVQGGDLDTYFIEKFVRCARHVETQSGRDKYGNFRVYSTRDCSVQRRNQKLIEEAPAPFLPAQVEERLREYSEKLFTAVGYVGLGTCEFLMTPENQVYFLEVNPRLQVEHTVTEEVCGLDLVREQLTIAAGGSISDLPPARGHSFELRITCEDPATGLTPVAGVLEDIRWPAGPGIRIDSGVEVGDEVSPAYDSMMGKIIVTAQSRNTAIARAIRALEELQISGVPTPKDLYLQILRDPAFAAPDGNFQVFTKWLEQTHQSPQHLASLAAGGDGDASVDSAASAGGGGAASRAAGGQASSTGLAGGRSNTLKSGAATAGKAGAAQMQTFYIEVDHRRVCLTLPQQLLAGGGILASSDAVPAALRRPVQPLRGGDSVEADVRKERDDKSRSGVIVAPMQAMVTRINVKPEQEVDKGDLLLVLESMKMENYVYAPIRGVVKEIFVEPAEAVEAGQTLVQLCVEQEESK